MAWAAGLFEGEGCVFLAGRSGNKTPALSLAMTDEDIVRRFHELVGVGSVLRKNRRAHYKTVFVWTTRRFEHVQALIAMFWPWLGDRRRRRATEVLRAEKVRKARGRRSPPLAVECGAGHPFTIENTGYRGNRLRNGRPERYCRQCNNERSLRFYYARKAV